MWGARDTTISFCEEPYAQSRYIAEFWNTWSNLAYVAVGARHILQGSERGCGWWLVLVGIGSACFHATARYYAQLLDELPMIGFVTHALLSLAPMDARMARPAVRAVVCALSATTLVAYVLAHDYEVFIIGFSILVLLIQERLLRSTALAMSRKFSRQGFCLIVAARFVWELEQRFCARWPLLAWGHVAWHVLSALACDRSLVAISLARCGHVVRQHSPQKTQ